MLRIDPVSRRVTTRTRVGRVPHSTGHDHRCRLGGELLGRHHRSHPTRHRPAARTADHLARRAARTPSEGPQNRRRRRRRLGDRWIQPVAGRRGHGTRHRRCQRPSTDQHRRNRFRSQRHVARTPRPRRTPAPASGASSGTDPSDRLTPRTSHRTSRRTRCTGRCRASSTASRWTERSPSQ